MYLIISDVHGCYFTMLRLLEKAKREYPNCRVILGGDLVDRGPHSRQVVEFAMENEIPTVMGNHESLCLYYHGRGHTGLYGQRDQWLLNGGREALKSWATKTTTHPIKLPKRVLDWMAALPMYLIYEDLLVHHTGHAFTKPRREMFGMDDPEEMRLWYRDTTFADDGYYRVFGHSPTKEPVITDKWACIDTGAAYASRGYGVMTAFHWPSKQVIQQQYDETPL